VSMDRWIAGPLLAGALLAAGCGGNKGTLTVSIVTPLTVDPFALAARVHIKVGDPAVAEQTVTVTGGHFSSDLKFKPPSTTLVGAVLIEALAADGTVVARGSTPPIGFVVADESVAVWVAPLGKAGALSVGLSQPRSQVTGALLPGLGALFAGGSAIPGDAGARQDVTDVDVFDAFTMNMVAAQPLPGVRTGALGLPLDQGGTNIGNVLLAGGGQSPGLTAFEASGDLGTWTQVASDASLARDQPAMAVLADGSTLITGGLNGGGMALATATLVTTVGTVEVTALAAPMASPHGAGHTTTAALGPGGNGALVVGAGQNASHAEFYSAAARTFADIDFKVALPSSGHSATPLASGQVLVLGGLSGTTGAATRDALVMDATARTATAPAAPLLSVPRAFHTATLLGPNNLLVCGGSDDKGAAIASCDLVDPTALTLLRTVPLGAARSGHVAVTLPQGIVLLTAGTDGAGMRLASAELYTP